MAATITCRIDRNGEVHIDVSGVKGATCTDLTQVLVQGLGQVQENCLTADAYEQELPDFVESFEGDE